MTSYVTRGERDRALAAWRRAQMAKRVGTAIVAVVVAALAAAGATSALAGCSAYGFDATEATTPQPPDAGDHDQ